jgi:hypothetical protein
MRAQWRRKLDRLTADGTGCEAEPETLRTHGPRLVQNGRVNAVGGGIQLKPVRFRWVRLAEHWWSIWPAHLKHPSPRVVYIRQLTLPGL